MAQKLTLTEYLRRRGAIKALTKIEADAFGIPWPLQAGWPARFGAMEVTDEMRVDLQARMATARHSTASKAQRGLEGIGDKKLAERAPLLQACKRACVPRAPDVPASRCQPMPVTLTLFPGFIRRQARRYRSH